MSTTVRVQQSNVSPHSRTVTLLLCLFLGGFGAHRFYVGKSGTAVALLILTFCGFGGIWAFIDLIMILAGSFSDNYGRFVTDWDGGPQQSASVVSVSTHTPPQQAPLPPPPKKHADEIFCNTCGSLSKKNETFCRNCGTALQL